ncbi:hypothetical protein SAMN05444008_11245 [Cnuella takakiae]|uniref:Uncharacterized protein n=1 Tax=Cnuella takakiae TaxID=1302690 RepID=A0A1M5EH29_9BACT|nr:hypothetical protein [Cnuella takakiae]OLY91176.1 hypothetical protein BUE76_04130 [Cnuella takakiae]SHF78583.1 hypothetical protein SAMN05444008_11245 [Cnuella takakiae]
MKSILLLLCSVICVSACAQNIPNAEAQIKNALLAAPADKRDGAAVYGYNSANQLVPLRKGSNELICLADNPAEKGFSVACYHRDLEPFMARGRALRQAGKQGRDLFDTREQEVKAGKLKMPGHPTTLYVFTAKDEDVMEGGGGVKNGYLRYVVYTPYATAASTGLPLKPDAPGQPWLMDPGTHGAHIMITPAKQ